MRQAIRHTYEAEPHDMAGSRFVIGAVICAALVVTLFAIHGGPDLFGGRFDGDALTAFNTP